MCHKHITFIFLLTRCLHLCDATQMDILKKFKNQKIKTKANPNTAQNTTKKKGQSGLKIKH